MAPARRPITAPAPLPLPARVIIGGTSSALKTEQEQETAIYYTCWMWLSGTNRPRQIRHILVRRQSVSEGSQLPRFSSSAGANKSKCPHSSPEENVQSPGPRSVSPAEITHPRVHYLLMTLFPSESAGQEGGGQVERR